MSKKASSKGKRRSDIRKLIQQVPDGQAIYATLIGLGEGFWEDDPNKDRTAAVMGVSFLEHALKAAIKHHLKPDVDDPDYPYLFEADEAPYREFAGRLRLARAIGIISKDDFDQLEAIRHVRNCFAHTMATVSFQTPEIAAYFSEFKIVENDQAFRILIDAFAPTHTLAGMAINGLPSHRLTWAFAVFLYYWKLINYPIVDWSSPTPWQ